MSNETMKPVGPWCGDLRVHDAHRECTGVFPERVGTWDPGPPSWEPEDESQVFTSGSLHTWGDAYAVPVEPEQRRIMREARESYQQIRNEQYAKAGLPMPGDAAAGVLRYLLAGVVAATGSIHTQEEFLTALDELLDHTLHLDTCYIEPHDSTCVCVIGMVRAVLPACEATYPRELTVDPSQWRCVRTAHLASPDRHVWAPR